MNQIIPQNAPSRTAMYGHNGNSQKSAKNHFFTFREKLSNNFNKINAGTRQKYRRHHIALSAVKSRSELVKKGVINQAHDLTQIKPDKKPIKTTRETTAKTNVWLIALIIR